LGNIGLRYEYTYHNTGFAAVETAAKAMGVKFKKRQGHALTAEIFEKGERIILAKPQTFMNLSGEAVKSLAAMFKPEPGKILVVYDDIDLPPGKLRLKPSGSAGSHNGMKSIVECLGTEKFARLRIGIGKPPEFWDLADYVLSEPDRKTWAVLKEACVQAAEAITEFVKGAELETLMQKYN